MKHISPKQHLRATERERDILRERVGELHAEKYGYSAKHKQKTNLLTVLAITAVAIMGIQAWQKNNASAPVPPGN